MPIAELQTGFVSDANWHSGVHGRFVVARVRQPGHLDEIYAVIEPTEPGRYKYSVASPSPLESNQVREYVGRYRTGFEVSEFIPDDLDQRWWLSGDLSALRPSPRGEESIMRVAVRGVLSPPGAWGHYGAYDRELTVIASEVLAP